MPEAPRRPLPVSMACFFVVFSSVLIVANMIAALNQWGSLEMQEGLQEVLATQPLAGMDIAMDELLDILRIAAQVVIVLAIAAGVFAVYAARGHEPSRWILSGMLVLAAVMFAATGLAGILPGVVAFACVGALWSRDAREWFAARNGRPVPERSRGRSARPDPFAPSTHDDGSSVAPAHPSAVPGQQEAVPLDQPTAAAPEQASAQPHRTPRPVSVAVWVSVATSATVVVLSALGLLAALLLDTDAGREALDQSSFYQSYGTSAGWSVDDLVTFMLVTLPVFLVLGVVGIAVALWARSGKPGGRTALTALSILTLVVSALATLGFLPFNLGTAAAAVVVLVQLRKPEARSWFARSAS